MLGSKSIFWLGTLDRQLPSSDKLKSYDAGKDCSQEEKGVTEDGWLDGITDSMGTSLSRLQEMVKDSNLVCCGPWGRTASETTELLSNTTKRWHCNQA